MEKKRWALTVKAISSRDLHAPWFSSALMDVVLTRVLWLWRCFLAIHDVS